MTGEGDLLDRVGLEMTMAIRATARRGGAVGERDRKSAAVDGLASC